MCAPLVQYKHVSTLYSTMLRAGYVNISMAVTGPDDQNVKCPNTLLLPKKSCTSFAKSSGTSLAAKWPPFLKAVQCCKLYKLHTQFLGTLKISFGKTATPVGTCMHDVLFAMILAVAAAADCIATVTKRPHTNCTMSTALGTAFLADCRCLIREATMLHGPIGQVHRYTYTF